MNVVFARHASVNVLHTGGGPVALMSCMKSIRLLGLIAALAGAAPLALAQTEKEPEKRGSIPIGTSQDGSGPADGALIGGSTQPALDASRTRAISRCKELSGGLQEECLQDLELSTTSRSRALDDAFPTTPAANDIYADPRRRRR